MQYAVRTVNNTLSNGNGELGELGELGPLLDSSFISEGLDHDGLMRWESGWWILDSASPLWRIEIDGFQAFFHLFFSCRKGHGHAQVPLYDGKKSPLTLTLGASGGPKNGALVCRETDRVGVTTRSTVRVGVAPWRKSDRIQNFRSPHGSRILSRIVVCSWISRVLASLEMDT